MQPLEVSTRVFQRVDKSLVAGRFGRRAASYEAATPVQQSMAQRLAEDARRHAARGGVRRILDLGCGTGCLTRMLRESFPSAEITGVDISPGMVKFARQHCPGADFVAADAEQYVHGLAPGYDLIVSNATMQWFQHPTETLRACRNLLAANGLLALSTFGHDTFRELRASFVHAYDKAGAPYRKHVAEFAPARFWRDLLPDAAISEERISQNFPDVRSFLAKVREAGASNSFDRQTYIPRNILKAAFDFYARNYKPSVGNGIVCTYHAVYVSCLAVGPVMPHEQPGLPRAQSQP